MQIEIFGKVTPFISNHKVKTQKKEAGCNRACHSFLTTRGRALFKYKTFN